MSRTPEISPIQGGASLMVAWRLDGQRVLVVGGGAVAAGRVRLCLEADARVRVVAPQLGAELRRRHRQGQIEWVPRTFQDPDLEGVGMVMTAIDDAQEGLRISGLCRAYGIPVNVADVPKLCDFWFASVHRDGPVQVAVCSNGQGPSISSRLIRQLAAALPPGVGQAVERFGHLRHAIRRRDPAPESSPRRMQWLTGIGRGWSYEALQGLDPAGIDDLVEAYAAGRPPPNPSEASSASGDADTAAIPDRLPEPPTVWMVGAGPGAPKWLTVQAQDVLAEADLVVADRLVAPEILSLVSGELRIARKLPGRSAAAQAELEAWVLEGVRDGKRVVRLKQGDPFVFGRAQEELLRFSEAGIRVEVVPGISSALAAPAVAGVPLTSRQVADRFTVATGQGADGKDVDLPQYDPQQTLVLLMAVGRASSLQRQLQEKGYPPGLPVAAIERASQPDERITWTCVRGLAHTLEQRQVRAPAVLVVGRAVGLAFERGALGLHVHRPQRTATAVSGAVP